VRLCETVYFWKPLSRFVLDHLCYYFTIIKCFFTMKWLLGSSTHPFDSRNWYLQQEMLLWLSSAENLIELSRRHMQRESCRLHSKETTTVQYTRALRNKREFESPCNNYPNLSNWRECFYENFLVGMKRSERSRRGWENYI
jgi:hypothetical protein